MRHRKFNGAGNVTPKSLALYKFSHLSFHIKHRSATIIMKLRKKSGVIYTFLSKRYADLRNHLHNVPSHLKSTDSTEILLKKFWTSINCTKLTARRRFLRLILITQAVFGKVGTEKDSLSGNSDLIRQKCLGIWINEQKFATMNKKNVTKKKIFT